MGTRGCRAQRRCLLRHDSLVDPFNTTPGFLEVTDVDLVIGGLGGTVLCWVGGAVLSGSAVGSWSPRTRVEFWFAHWLELELITIPPI